MLEQIINFLTGIKEGFLDAYEEMSTGEKIEVNPDANQLDYDIGITFGTLTFPLRHPRRTLELIYKR